MMDLRNLVWFGTKKLSKKGKINLKRRNFCLSEVLKERKGMDAYLKNQFDFTGVKAALL